MANESERERERWMRFRISIHVPISFVWHDLFSSWVSIQITLDPIPVNLSVCFGQYLQFMTVLQRKLQVCVMCIHQIWPRKHDGRLTKENLPLHANSWHNFHHLQVYVYLTTGYTGTTSSLYQKIAMFSLKIVGLYSRGHTLSTVLQSPLLMTFKSSRLVLNYNESHFH